MTRRQATRDLLFWMAGSPLLRAQQQALAPPIDRLPALDDLVNVFEFEPVAKLKIPHSTYEYVADRKSTRLNSSHIQKSRMPSSA